jgi:hypothetical protein
MLRVVLKFDDVVSLIVAAHQLGLRASPHPPHMLDGHSHGRHASHAQPNPQENCSATGRGNREAGIYLPWAGMKQEGVVRQNKPEARK